MADGSVEQRLKWAWVAGLRRGKKQTRRIWEDRTTWTLIRLREDGFSWTYAAAILGISVMTAKRWMARRIYYPPLADHLLASQSVHPWSDEAKRRVQKGLGGARRLIRLALDNTKVKD